MPILAAAGVMHSTQIRCVARGPPYSWVDVPGAGTLQTFCSNLPGPDPLALNPSPR